MALRQNLKMSIILGDPVVGASKQEKAPVGAFSVDYEIFANFRWKLYSVHNKHERRRRWAAPQLLGLHFIVHRIIISSASSFNTDCCFPDQ